MSINRKETQKEKREREWTEATLASVGFFMWTMMLGLMLAEWLIGSRPFDWHLLILGAGLVGYPSYLVGWYEALESVPHKINRRDIMQTDAPLAGIGFLIWLTMLGLVLAEWLIGSRPLDWRLLIFGAGSAGYSSYLVGWYEALKFAAHYRPPAE